MEVVLDLLSGGLNAALDHGRAAAAALLKTWCKYLNQDQVVEIFKQYAVDLGDPGFDNTYGWGMLDFSNFNINATPPKKPAQIGDVNLDGKVDVKDATALQRYLAEIASLTDKQLAVADANGDGKINVSDVTAIQRYVAEVIPSLGK